MSPDVTFTVAQGFVFLGIVVVVGVLACSAYWLGALAEWLEDRRFDREMRS